MKKSTNNYSYDNFIRNIWQISLLLSCFLFVGCLDQKETSSDSSYGLSVDFKNSAPAGSSSGAQSATRIPLLFGSMEVAAYNYRPGESIQMGAGWTSSNWSRWLMVDPGGSAGRDFLLENGGNLNISKLNSDHFYDDVTEDFVSNVGHFSMDIIYVYAMISPINANNSVCGSGYLSNKQPSDFPTLDFMTNCRLNRFIKNNYDNTFLNGIYFMSIRKDWFSVPVQIYRHSNLGSQNQCITSDVPLTAYQIDLIDSIMHDRIPNEWPKGLYQSSCTQIRQNTISIIPHKTDVATVKFKQHSVPVDPITTEDGEVLPQPNRRIVSSKIKMSVGFNMLSSMFVDYNSFNDSTATSNIMLNRSSDGSLFGISIDFSEAANPK